MIIEFSVQNFRSIYDKVTLSLQATKLTGKEATLNNIFYPVNYSRLPLLRTAVIYGANASGKSNLLFALGFFKAFIMKSTDFKFEETLPYYMPFALLRHAKKEPSAFSMDFIANNNIRYIYSFKLTEKEVVEESLSSFTSNRETKLFVRKKGERIQFSSSFKGEKKNLEDQLLSNNLLLSKAANSNYVQMQEVYAYFTKDVNIATIDGFGGNGNFSKKKSFEDVNFKKQIANFLKVADTGIETFEVKEKGNSKMAEDFPVFNGIGKFGYETEVIHYTSDKKPEQARWSMDQESTGTLKLFAMAGPIIDILNNGHILVFDEINNSLHPYLTKFIVDLFNNEKTNPKNAQLIFTTHDTTLLTKELFRRDQIWFTEKNQQGMTELYSMCSFDKKEVRWDIPFDKWYLTGRFGALPTVQDFKIKPE